MAINKNDCLDCDNSCRVIGVLWECTKGHKIILDSNSIPEVLDDECSDFKYQQ